MSVQPVAQILPPTTDLVVPDTVDGLVAAIPIWRETLMTTQDMDMVHGLWSVAGGAKETARRLGFPDLHCQLSWIEERALRRLALAERRSGRKTIGDNMSPLSDTEKKWLSRARAPHRNISSEAFDEAERECSAEVIPATPRTIAAIARGNYKAQGTGENEWYTPAWLADMAREAMGSIDLDPASNEEANRTIRAATFLTKQDDGLSCEWKGNVWLNPPYERKLVECFIDKLASSYSAGLVAQAILLTHNNTDTEWFRRNVAGLAAAVCFTKRIKFYRGEDVASPVNGQMLSYFGPEPDRFSGVFSEAGRVWR